MTRCLQAISLRPPLLAALQSGGMDAMPCGSGVPSLKLDICLWTLAHATVVLTVDLYPQCMSESYLPKESGAPALPVEISITSYVFWI